MGTLFFQIFQQILLTDQIEIREYENRDNKRRAINKSHFKKYYQGNGNTYKKK